MEGGARGLLIVFSAFMVQLLAFGNYACIGIYTVHLLYVFDNDAVGVSLISSIHFATLLCCGPMASFLMAKVSYRKLSLVGAALVTAGIFCTPLITSLPAMYVFFGVFAGLGGCLVYVPSHVLSGLYYDKYRSLSTGVATAGTGMGAILMPLVVGLLIEKYSWKGSLMILSGLEMHLFIFALFMIPPPHLSKDQRVDSSSRLSLTINEDLSPDQEKIIGDSEDQEFVYTIGNSAHNKLDNHFSNNHDTGKERQDRHHERGIDNNCHEFQNKTDKTCSLKEANFGHCSVNGIKSTIEGGAAEYDKMVPDDDISKIFIPSYYSWTSGLHCTLHLSQDDDMEDKKLLETPTPTSPDGAFSTDDFVEEKNGKCKNVDSKLLVNENKKLHRHNTIKEELKHHLHIISDCKFIIYFISTLLWSMSTTLIITFCPEVIYLKGHSAVDTAFIVTFYGIGQLIGSVLVSILGSFLGRRIILYIASNVLAGVFIAIIPLFNSFAELAGILVCGGVFYGGILGLYMIVMVDLVGVKDMEVGLGYVLLASGVGCFMGPPFGGWLSQVYGGYTESFYTAGVINMIAGLMMLPVLLPRCKTVEKKT